MNREDIIRMAREIGIWPFVRTERHEEMADMLERLASLIAATEREACAKIADMRAATQSEPDRSAESIAWAIRRRGAA